MSGRLGWAADSATAIVNASPATAAAVNPSSHPLMRRTWRDQVGRARTGGGSDLAEDFAGGGWRGGAAACCSGGLGVAHYKKHLPGLAGAGRILRAAPPPRGAPHRSSSVASVEKFRLLFATLGRPDNGKSLYDRTLLLIAFM